MISSGDTVLEIASLLKKVVPAKSISAQLSDSLQRDSRNLTTLRKGIFDKLLTTNLIYQSPELLARDYYITCDMSKYIALIIDTLNHDMSVSHLLNPADRIKRCVNNYMAQYDKINNLCKIIKEISCSAPIILSEIPAVHEISLFVIYNAIQTFKSALH